MADRRSQSDESLIVEYFTVQPLAACDAVLNQISDVLRERRPRKARVDNAKPAPEPTERKPSQKRKAGKEATAFSNDAEIRPCAKAHCGKFVDDNIHQLNTFPGYHEFVEPAGEAKGASG